MPSAATAKLEKQASTEAVDPIRQAIIMLEHKIRNLEKRKRKIETYREEQTLGKDLNTDQLNAISKYNEVLQTLDFARDLCKQIHVVASDAAKQQKKQARKEAQEKAQQELAKVKEILIVQEVLQNMGLENVREDFRSGQNGAAQLSEEDLKYLDDLYTEVSPKHGSGQSVSLQAQLQLSAEHLISVVEGKQKEFVGTTYGKLKEIITTIISCGYFDQSLEVGASEESPAVVVDEVPANVEPVGEAISFPPEEQQKAPVIEATASYVPAPTVSVPAAVQLPPPVPNAAVVPTPVAAVESSYFSTAAPTFVPAQPQAPRPLNEVIGSVSSTFNFLQESELDTPDLSVILTTTPTQHGTPPPAVPVAVAPIQTQTFTNQNFAAVSTAPVQPQVQVVFQASSEITQAHIPGFATGTPNPPPPIPMPPSHQLQQQAVPPPVVQQFTTAPPPQTPVVTYASQAQQQIKQEVPPADVNDVKTEQKVPVSAMPEAEWTGDNSGGGDWSSNDNQTPEWSATDNPGEWNQQTEGNQGDWNSSQNEEWYPVSQGDNYTTQGGARNYGGRGGRGGRGSGGRGSSNGYSGRGRGSGGNYQNGRGGGSGGYGNYRNNEGGNNNFYQNGYQQRDNFNNTNYGGGYKRGGRGGTGAPRGGTGQRGGTGNRGGNNPRGRGGNFMRGGGKQ